MTTNDNSELRLHPIDMLPVIREIIDGGLEDITTNLTNIKAIQARPYGTLDEKTAARFISLFTEGLEFIPAFANQLAHWQQTKLTDTQRHEVARLQTQLGPLEAALTEGLAIANEMTERTIEKIMAKSDEQLGLEAVIHSLIHKPL
ncbi:MAG: hypothetical protein ACLPPF_16955 [Rhodomicrobium sp.]